MQENFDVNSRFWIVSIVFLVFLVLSILLKKLRTRIKLAISDLIWDHHIGKGEAEQNREIYTELTELRAFTSADRAYIFRFHNGSEFLPGHPSWKVSCTHEIVKHGVAYESARLQGVLVSRIQNIVSPIITGTSSSLGVTVVECEECPFKARCLRENKRVTIFQVDEMENSYCKFHLESQNIKTAVMCSMVFNGNVYGMVGIDLTDSKLPKERYSDVARLVCRSTDRIQFFMRNKFDVVK